MKKFQIKLSILASLSLILFMPSLANAQNNLVGESMNHQLSSMEGEGTLWECHIPNCCNCF